MSGSTQDPRNSQDPQDEYDPQNDQDPQNTQGTPGENEEADTASGGAPDKPDTATDDEGASDA